VLLYNSRYKNNNMTEWKLKFWWLDFYKIVKINLKKNNYNIVKLNDTEKSETVSELRLKSYLLRCNTMSHDYQWTVDTQWDASSDFNIDFNDDHVQHDSLTSLIDHWSHNIEDNTEYTDFNNLWHLLCRLLFAETQFFWKKRWDMLSLFCKKSKQWIYCHFLTIVYESYHHCVTIHIILYAQSFLSISHSSDQHCRHQCVLLFFLYFIVIRNLVLFSFTLTHSITDIMSEQFSHITKS